MVKFLPFLLFFITLFFLAHSHSDNKLCEHPVSIINRGYNLPIYLYNIQLDTNNVTRYADIALSLTNSQFDRFCILHDGRIQHYNTGLFLNVHGQGYFCWARDSCTWACQIDAYFTQGTSWFWKDSVSDGVFHQLNAINGTMTAFPNGFVNIYSTSNYLNVYQQWIFHEV